jgi:hypothetical protein
MLDIGSLLSGGRAEPGVTALRHHWATRLGERCQATLTTLLDAASRLRVGTELVANQVCARDIADITD